MGVYSPESLGIKPPPGGFAEGGWYQGRQMWAGSLSNPGAIHPQSSQQGAGQLVSKEVNIQSAAAQGVTPQNIEGYLEQQRQQSAGVAPSGQQTPVTRTAPSGQTAGTSGTSGMAGTPTPETPNFPEIYKGLQESSGVTKLEQDFADMTTSYNEAQSKINDNPFLSEANRVGRIQKLTMDYNNSTANIQNQIATKKADVETQLNLQMRQFDIESTAAQNALSQAMSLLQAGALDNASGESIASLTRSTGIPSDMWYSAINANKKKNANVGVQTFTAENGEVWAVAIDGNTGDIVKKTSLGILGNVQGGGGGRTTQNVQAQFLSEADTVEGQSIEGQWFGQFPQLILKYAPTMSLEKIYSLYLQSSLGQTYGAPTEDRKEMKELYDYARSGKEPKED